MELRTLIIDDEPIALEKLKKYVERIPMLKLSGAFSNGFDALQYTASNQVDLIITDIHMPDLNGMDFVKSLPNNPLVIFTTAYPEYAIEGFKISAVDYLLKPYGFVEFQLAVNKAIEKFEARNKSKNPVAQENSLYLKVDYRFVRINLSDIRYIKGYGEYLQIFVENKQRPVVTLSSFANIMEKLTPNFQQVHRSYIVNMNKIESVERNRILMGENEEIPVSDSYKQDLQQFLLRHSIGSKSSKQFD